MRVRPRRSVLYMPGSNARAIEKARTLDTDAVILDLEDAVSPAQKPAARDQVCAAIHQGGFGNREVIVRVNSLDTPWGQDDLEAVAGRPPDAVLLPKISEMEDVTRAVEVLNQAGGPEDLPIWVMAETPLGILNIQDICRCSPRLEVLVMGTSDLARDLRVRHTADRIGLLAALSRSVIAARAYGLEILDGVYLDLHNAEGFRDACFQGRDLGFDGKTCIHPNQLKVANEIFSPTRLEIDHAREVIDAWQQAKADGRGVVVVNGKMVEALHVEDAERILRLDEAIRS
ncbi:MAG: CoA ester lyase [Ectothiorhodospiraceae bacterium]|nr:CoA ester lyase [Ectothiorhodospiraceae bacterium]